MKPVVHVQTNKVSRFCNLAIRSTIRVRGVERKSTHNLSEPSFFFTSKIGLANGELLGLMIFALINSLILSRTILRSFSLSLQGLLCMMMLGSINRISDWPVFTRVRRKPVKNESLNFSRREINRLLSLPCTSVSTSLILISFSAVLLQTLITFVLHIAKLFCVILRQNLDLKFHDQSRYHILNNYQHGHEKFISNVKSLIHTMDRI